MDAVEATDTTEELMDDVGETGDFLSMKTGVSSLAEELVELVVSRTERSTADGPMVRFT